MAAKKASKITHKKVKAATPDEIINGADEPVTTVTDAATTPERIESMATKKQSPNLEDRGGQVVATVSVPAHEQEVVIAHSQIEGCAIAAVQAWDAVKGADDAPFAAMAISHRHDLLHCAEAVYRTGKVMEGDSSLARFEQEVRRIQVEQNEAKKAAKAA